MIRIPAGTYDVGSTRRERQSLSKRYGLHPTMMSDELEARKVALREFHIDEYPVTNAQYAAFIVATGAPEPYDWPLHAWAGRADHPVVGVGGEDARRYAEWVSKRLPTPEEWEAAFRGVRAQPDRTVPGSHWAPITCPATADPGPVSEFGVHGFGQVCEWTSATDVNGQFPFRMLKGGCWFCQESWSLRPASGFYAFAPWCRQWTGLRCAADEPVGGVPTAPLPKVGAPTYHTNPSVAKDAARLLYRGGRGMGVAFPQVGEALGIACPEGCIIDGEPLRAGESEDLYSSGPASAAGGEVTYRFRARQLEMEVRFKAGRDFFDMDYAFANPTSTAATIQPSSCMNAGLIDAFHDLEGSRTCIWPGRGDWLPVRSLPRGERFIRWIRYVTLPRPDASSVLAAVLGKDSPLVFGYGRVGLVRPMALANNFCFSCLHLDPVVPVPPRGSSEARARVYCIEGGLDELRRRFIDDFALPRS